MSYFEIGIYHPKTRNNVGTLWRSAYQLGASGLFTIGRRYERQSSDTCKAIDCLPLRHYVNLEDFLANRPFGAILVGIETGFQSLAEYTHPEKAVYLLGAEDHGLPPEVIGKCNQLVSIESLRSQSYSFQAGFISLVGC